jgi:hypothetical protein
MLVLREGLIHGILNDKVDGLRVDDIPAEVGAGKTTLLRCLQETNEPGDVSKPGRRLVVLLDLEDYDPGHKGDWGAKASVGAIQGSFAQFERMLLDLTRLANPSAVDSLRASFTSARNCEVVGARLHTLEHSILELENRLTTRVLAGAWRSAADVGADVFIREWNKPGGPQLRVLLLDNADRLADQEIGEWLGLASGSDRGLRHDASWKPLLMRLERTIVVLTREVVPTGESDSSAPPLPFTRLCTRTLPAFASEEVEDYVRGLNRGNMPAGVASRVYHITQGHPATVAMVGELLAALNSDAANDVVRYLDSLPTDREEQLANLVDSLLRQVERPEVATALEAAAVPRKVDTELLTHLLEKKNGSSERDLFDRLARFSFSEQLSRFAGRPDVIRIHSSVRRAILRRLSHDAPDRLVKLHEMARGFYGNKMTTEKGFGPRSYGSWYVYEDLSWQEWKREFLYHTAQTAERKARKDALLNFALVFLDAWWWWGYYVHFDFCDRLVSDLAALGRTVAIDKSREGDVARGLGSDQPWPELEALHAGLDSILRNYPLGLGKPSSAPWEQVEDALLKVESACGLDQRVGRRWTHKQVHVAGLIDIFLAHAARYGRAPLEVADCRYASADALFERNGDTWNRSWIAYERADLRVAYGDIEGAENWLRTAVDIAEQLCNESDIEVVEDHAQRDSVEVDNEAAVDHELISNLHRLSADIQWLQGKRDRAADEYGRAVLHSYLFHDVGGPPDEYTLQFYVDIRARAINRILELRRQDGLTASVAGGIDVTFRAVECARRMAAIVRTAVGLPLPDQDELRGLLKEIEGLRPLPLASALFPKGPEFGELGLDWRGTPFHGQFQGHKKALNQKDVRGDLHHAGIAP